MRSNFAASFLFASLIIAGPTNAAECPVGALGTARTIVVDPAEHVRLGSHQYRETLPLRDREVVLTFDDGPLPPYTTRILDTLASECVKATFFMVGRMARAYPAIARRIDDEGHTVANHSQNHPFTFHKMPVEQAAREIEDGFASLRAVLADPQAVAPFFRIPGLLRQDAVERYLASRGYMTWSVDFHADDWTHIPADEIARRAVERIESKGRGIMLLHDIQPATALALPTILRELKARGFKIVHVKPATPDRPKTATEPEQWVVRSTPAPQPQHWPRVVTASLGGNPPMLAAPSPANFGLRDMHAAPATLALAPRFERAPMREGEIPLPPTAPWPRHAEYSVAQEVQALPVPAEHNFRYSRAVRIASPDKPKLAARKPETSPVSATNSIGIARMPGPPRPPRPIGHIFSVMRPFPLPFTLR